MLLSDIALKFSIVNCLHLLKLSPSWKEETNNLVKEKKFSLHNWQSFSLEIMATLGNRKKLAAVSVSSETPENTRNNQSQNTPNLGMAEEYFTQVPEEIDGRVTKKLSKAFGPTESRKLDACLNLSNLDEFFLKPHFRTCFVAVPGTSRNGISENRKPPEIVPYSILVLKRCALPVTPTT